jgi:hypothetical protein
VWHQNKIPRGCRNVIALPGRSPCCLGPSQHTKKMRHFSSTLSRLVQWCDGALNKMNPGCGPAQKRCGCAGPFDGRIVGAPLDPWRTATQPKPHDKWLRGIAAPAFPFLDLRAAPPWSAQTTADAAPHRHHPGRKSPRCPQASAFAFVAGATGIRFPLWRGPPAPKQGLERKSLIN